MPQVTLGGRYTIWSAIILLVGVLLWGLATHYYDIAHATVNAGQLEIKQISVRHGSNHTCAVAVDNKAYCWGLNSSGQLGNNSTSDESNPVAVHQGAMPTGATILQIASGQSHTCAIASDHKAYCWGSGGNGRLGDGSSSDQNVPVAVSQGAMPSGATILQIAAGEYHTCAIASDHKAYCWGRGVSGELGNGSTASDHDTPVAVSLGAMPSGSTVRQITVGTHHTCAIASNNKAYCWGHDGAGRLGTGGGGDVSTPTAVLQGAMPSGATFIQISAGWEQTCSVATDNKAYCWGSGDSGRLGDGAANYSDTPQLVAQGAMPSGAMITHIETGNTSSCAIAMDNKVYCWGEGSQGRLGNGGTSQQDSPVAVSQGAMPSGATILQVAVGNTHACVIASDNRAYCWGDAVDGRLGNGTTTPDQSTPVAVSTINRQVELSQTVYRAYDPSSTTSPGSPLEATNTSGVLSSVAGEFRLRIGLTNVSDEDGPTMKSVSVGMAHACGIGRNGRAYCWGEGGGGKLGNGLTDDQSTPVAVAQGDMPIGVTIRQISAGTNHTCAVASNGRAYCWGEGGGGRLGNGSSSDQSTPVEVSQGALPDDAAILEVSAGDSHTCATASDNRGYCWGDGAFGKLGHGSGSDEDMPVAIQQGDMPDTDVIQVTTGELHTCAIGSDGQAYCWGWGASNDPRAVGWGDIPGGVTLTQIETSYYHTCALATNNKAYCWGTDSHGRLGNGATGDMSTPSAVVQGAIPGGVTILSIAVAPLHSCAIASNNKAYCWGNGDNGRLGNDTWGDQDAPVATLQGTMPSSATILYLSAGGSSTCAVASDNKAYCWGEGAGYRLGTGSTNDALSPVAVLPGERPAGTLYIKSFSGGFNHSCAIASDNKAYCWGRNVEGNLGDGSTSQRTTPVAVVQGNLPSGATILQITSGEYHTCVIASDHKAYCWGWGGSGQLGNNTTTGTQSSPVAVSQGAMPAGATIRQIAAGREHTCVIASDNKVYCWGRGGDGQLGNGSTGQQNVPVAVLPGVMPSGAMVRQITTGNWHTCAIASDNKAYCWGWGGSGQLGHGSTPSAQSTPVAVSQGAMPSGSLVRQIAAGREHTCVIASDNKVYCWGRGSDGQLGNNATSQSNIPVAVSQGAMPSGSIVNQIAMGQYHSCAIASDHKAYCWGWGDYGQLGNAAMPTAQSTPVAVSQGAMPSPATIRHIMGGQGHTCAVASDNKGYCWGNTGSGRLGNGLTTPNLSVPTPVLKGAMTDTRVTIVASQLDLSLQVAPLDGARVCSNVTSGWTDVTSTSDMNWGSSPPSHTTTISSFGSDPSAPTTGGFTYQSIVQSGSFSNNQAIASQQTGLWDFVLNDRSSKAGTDYCFRIISNTSSTEVDLYDYYPHVVTATGSLDIQYVDISGTPIDTPDTDTQFETAIVTSNESTTTASLVDDSSKLVEIHNSASNGGWGVSLAATGGSSAEWFSGTHAYPYNAAIHTDGQLSVDMTSAGSTASGTDPTGDACTTTGLTLNSGVTAFSDIVSAITLITGSPSAQFNCNWRLQNVGLSQVIPAFQPAGNYTLDMTMTVVAN